MRDEEKDEQGRIKDEPNTSDFQRDTMSYGR
jgi:hypothetical protein